MRFQRPSIGSGRSITRLGLISTLALAIAACGGTSAGAPGAGQTGPAVGGGSSDTPTRTQPTSGGTGTTESGGPAADAGGGPRSATVELGREVWFAGFHVTFRTATLTPEGRRGRVEIEAAFENLGRDDAMLDATITLVSGGEAAAQGLGMRIPRVIAGTTTNGILAYSVKDTFRFDDAVLTLGRATVQQAIVPLSPAAGTLVSLAPTTLAITGSGRAGDLELTTDGGALRADRPESHGQMKAGRLALTVHYAVTYRGGNPGGFPFTGQNVALRLPDGTIVRAVQDGLSQSSALIPATSTAGDLASRFAVPDPAAGDYALIVQVKGAEGEIPFTVR